MKNHKAYYDIYRNLGSTPSYYYHSTKFTNTEQMTTKKKCLLCKKIVKGRSDKKFCSVACKSNYHSKLRSVNETVTAKIDKILHRNRAILLEILGKSGRTKKVLKLELDKKNFNYSYITGMHINKETKQVFHIYDFSYLLFSDQEVLIYRNPRMIPST